MVTISGRPFAGGVKRRRREDAIGVPGCRTDASSPQFGKQRLTHTAEPISRRNLPLRD